VRRLALFLLGQIKNPETQPAQFALPYGSLYLAAKIGCTQENLSRAFANLRAERLWQCEASSIVDFVLRLQPALLLLWHKRLVKDSHRIG
jgi:hypothetical protein